MLRIIRTVSPVHTNRHCNTSSVRQSIWQKTSRTLPKLTCSKSSLVCNWSSDTLDVRYDISRLMAMGKGRRQSCPGHHTTGHLAAARWPVVPAIHAESLHVTNGGGATGALSIDASLPAITRFGVWDHMASLQAMMLTFIRVYGFRAIFCFCKNN